VVFKLFSNAERYELAPEFGKLKELNFDNAEVWVDVDKKKVILYTDNGNFDINFNDYDELLWAITRVAKTVYVNDLNEAFNNAENDLTVNRRDPRLESDMGVIEKLLNEINKARDNLFNSVYKVMIKIGCLNEEEVKNIVNSDPEIKRAVKDGIKLYKELCWEKYGDEDPDYCYTSIPFADFVVYVIPEDKKIMIIVDIDEVGEVYKIVKTYDNAYDFLKTIDEYSNKVVDP